LIFGHCSENCRDFFESAFSIFLLLGFPNLFRRVKNFQTLYGLGLMLFLGGAYRMTMFNLLCPKSERSCRVSAAFRKCLRVGGAESSLTFAVEADFFRFFEKQSMRKH